MDNLLWQSVRPARQQGEIPTLSRPAAPLENSVKQAIYYLDTYMIKRGLEKFLRKG
jgi:hypothetical protein